MLARLAENLFWAGRYVERAEDTARLLDVTFHGQLESPSSDPEEPWRALLASLSQLPAYRAERRPLSEDAVTAFLVTDSSHAGSIASAVRQTRDNLRSLREQVSAELWEAVNGFHLELLDRDLTHDLQSQRYALYAMVKQRCQMLSGVADQTMDRTDGWRFLYIGRQLERAIMTGRLLRVYFHDLPDSGDIEFHHWRNLLRAASVWEAYNRVRGRGTRPDRAVDYLLLDPASPRSVLFCLRSAEWELERLASPDPSRRATRALGRVRAHLEYSDAVERHGPGREAFLSTLISDVQGAIDELSAEFFAAARPAAIHVFEVS